MAKTLKLNRDAMFADYKAAISKALDTIGYGYMNSVVSSMRTQRGAADVTVESDDKAEMLVRKIVGGAWAVIDSWGTGSKMDTSNKALNEYLSSGDYNPARPRVPGAPITGRPAGQYTDIFGEQQTSSGKMAGLNLELRSDSPIQAQSPSGAFQDTDKWFKAEKTLIEKLQEVDRKFWAGLYTGGIAKYWRFG